MAEQKSFIDNLFDAADAALTPLEKVLSKDSPASQKQDSQKQKDPDVIDAEFKDHKTNARKEDWESGFNVHHWAAVTTDKSTTWHAFEEAKVHPICDDKLKADTSNRQVLEHGKVISACSSCIIGVSK